MVKQNSTNARIACILQSLLKTITMPSTELTTLIHHLFAEVEKLLPSYLQNHEDERIANGNCAACVIDEEGMVYGRLYGTYNIRARESFRVAWTKASQVWITGMKTGEYEKKFFNNEVAACGIEVPDLIGWEGGQPLTLKDGRKLFVGFSGIRGIYDLEIMVKALEKVEGA
jgi:glc operon protein GlcG